MFYTIESTVRRMGYKVRSRREDAASNFYMQQDVFILLLTGSGIILCYSVLLSSLVAYNRSARRSTEPSSLVHRRQWPYLDVITEPRDVSKSARGIPAVHGKSA